MFKKVLFTALVITLLALLFTGCGDDNRQTENDTPPSVETEQPTPETQDTSQQGTPAPEPSGIDLSGGTYEGELDANGLFTGWGIWIYENHRYEGWFANGMPNGSGTLDITFEPDTSVDAYYISWKHEGNFVNGLANGTSTIIMTWSDDVTDTFTVEFDMGVALQDIVHGNRRQFRTGGSIFGVLPWKREVIQPEISTPIDSNETSTPSGGSFFPGIDDSVLPEVLKMKIGTDFTVNQSGNTIEIEFTGATEAEINALFDHLLASSTGQLLEPIYQENNERIRGGGIDFDWGSINIKANLDKGTVSIIANLW